MKRLLLLPGMLNAFAFMDVLTAPSPYIQTKDGVTLLQTLWAAVFSLQYLQANTITHLRKLFNQHPVMHGMAWDNTRHIAITL